ncbi:SPOR domain-containing protein [Sulfitobacter albidus]|uniref:SPOR domain-containing protein n=1 Tax=Sulfitobacter albidus TaxID=2829501 RepID=A0A975JBU0_9RHOB|nr:SPOR domain-containing protein [Sulfitobacter albidus]QUJ75477.1 SPOR domain-containing protein [Sulfitobacter albidus]
MKFTRLVSVALFLASVSAGALSAQTRPGSEPAEFPPASFKGKQYVDSKGCVFIRAGIDGNVSWVPRVTRTRNGVCGFKPTFAGQVTEAPAPADTQTAEVITITNPAPAAAAPAPAPVVRRAPAPRPAPKVVRQVAKRPAPIVEVAPAPVAAPAPAPVVRTAAGPGTACPDASPLSQRYLQRGSYDVRCGPQAQPIVAARRAAPAAAASAAAAPVAVAQARTGGPIRVDQNRRIVPRHVAVNRVNTTNVKVPHGYRRVWEDGRLNPRRAEQSLAGHRAMSLIWTSTVPRRLINQADGRDVTASIPLVYPYVDYARQSAELGQVSIVQRNGQTLKRILRNTTAALTPNANRQARVTTVNRTPIYSSRSAAPAAPKAQRAQPKGEVAGRGFVQIGAFTDTAAAHARAKRIQRMGLPVRVGVYTKNGQTTRLVIAGPFKGQGAVDSVIARLRSAGYNATAR